MENDRLEETLKAISVISMIQIYMIQLFTNGAETCY